MLITSAPVSIALKDSNIYKNTRETKNNYKSILVACWSDYCEWK